MPSKDTIHNRVKQAIIKDGWKITDQTYNEIFDEPLGKLVIEALPLNLIIIDVFQMEVKQWIPKRPIEKSSNK